MGILEEERKEKNMKYRGISKRKYDWNAEFCGKA